MVFGADHGGLGECARTRRAGGVVAELVFPVLVLQTDFEGIAARQVVHDLHVDVRFGSSVSTKFVFALGCDEVVPWGRQLQQSCARHAVWGNSLSSNRA